MFAIRRQFSQVSLATKISRIRAATSLPISLCRQALCDASEDEEKAMAILMTSSSKPHQSTSFLRQKEASMLSSVLEDSENLWVLQLRFATDFASRSKLSRDSLPRLFEALKAENDHRKPFSPLSFDSNNSSILALSSQLREPVSASAFLFPLKKPTVSYIHPPLPFPDGNDKILVGERIISILQLDTLFDSTSSSVIARQICQQFAGEGHKLGEISAENLPTLDMFLERPFLFNPELTIKKILLHHSLNIVRAIRIDGFTPLILEMTKEPNHNFEATGQ